MDADRGEAPAILAVTRAHDDHVGLVEAELAARGARVVRLDTERYARDRALVGFRAGGGRASAVVRAAGGELAAAEIGAVLYRQLQIPTAPDVAPGPARELAESELRAAIEGSLLSLDAHWVNHPHDNRRARHKLLQLALATEVGLSVPDTCVTADPAEVRERFDAWGGRMIVKLVGGQVVAPRADEQHVVHTTLVEAADLADDDALSACPALYQRYVEKAFELRATVVGDELLTCRIDSQRTRKGRVDWRRASPEELGLVPYELDGAAARGCLALMRRLNLQFAGIDLIVTPAGETVFLELNAAGTWRWAQEAAGLPIAAAIADNLVAGALEVRARRGGRPG